MNDYEVAKTINCPDGIRLFNLNDFKSCYEIYRYYVDHSVYNLDLVPDSEDAFLESILKNMDFPFLAAEHEGEIIGYGTAHHYRPKEGYQHAAELTIYFKDGPHYGLAGALADTLTEILKMQNIRTEIACITASNKKSRRMSQKRGFEEYGYLKEAAVKKGEYQDVIWMARQIQNEEKPADQLEDFIPFIRFIQPDKPC